MWSDITSWISDKIAGMKVLAADFNLILSYIKKVYDNTVYLKTLVAAISNTTLYTSSNYAMTETDGYRNIFVYANTADVTITLPKKSLNLNRPVRVVYVKGGTYKVIVNPHADDANTLSGDGMASMWLAKVGDYVEYIESADTGFWEVVNERITSQLRLDTYAGYGSTDNKIMRFTNVVENIGNMFSENHVSGYSSNAKGLEITINKSGKYAFHFSTRILGTIGGLGLTKGSSQLTTDIISITSSSTRIAVVINATGLSLQVSFIGNLMKNDIIRPHTSGDSVTPTDRSIFSCSYLGR
jgi:hypothetical protein